VRTARRIFGIDAALVGSACALVALSIYVLATAMLQTTGKVDTSYEHKQLVFAAIGIAIAVAVSRVPIGWWAKWWLHLFFGTIIALVAVRFLGTEVNGARSWFALGPLRLQPSEFGKIAILIAAAGFISSRQREIRELPTVLRTLGLVGVPMLVILAQPDFGTAQVYGWMALGLLFFAGARWTHLSALVGSLVVVLALVMVLLPAVGIQLLDDYQMARLTGFIHPEQDDQGQNFQVNQAKIAVGAGGVLGRPSDEPTQVQQGFVPEPQTDFIFAAFVERWGFVGGAALLGLYALFLSRLLYATGTAASSFGRLVAGGVTVLFAAQIVVNIGVVIGVLPVTGVTLPLFSYGGSSLWTSMGLIGLVLAVLREAEEPSVRYQRRTGRPAAGYGSLRDRATATAALAGSGSGSGSARRASRRRATSITR
jgi:rod shape determining protein RodA